MKKGGLYGIHEISLIPEDISEEEKLNIQKDLAHGIKVNARPLTTQEWRNLFEQAGFKIKEVTYAPMQLLAPTRVIKDEGIWRTLKIVFNILANPKARKRIEEMRASFVKNKKKMQAISIIAEKR